jgi:hypothetical protein
MVRQGTEKICEGNAKKSIGHKWKGEAAPGKAWS